MRVRRPFARKTPPKTNPLPCALSLETRGVRIWDPGRHRVIVSRECIHPAQSEQRAEYQRGERLDVIVGRRGREQQAHRVPGQEEHHSLVDPVGAGQEQDDRDDGERRDDHTDRVGQDRSDRSAREVLRDKSRLRRPGVRALCSATARVGRRRIRAAARDRTPKAEFP